MNILYKIYLHFTAVVVVPAFFVPRNRMERVPKFSAVDGRRFFYNEVTLQHQEITRYIDTLNLYRIIFPELSYRFIDINRHPEFL
jgi:hypothetical protein